MVAYTSLSALYVERLRCPAFERAAPDEDTDADPGEGATAP